MSDERITVKVNVIDKATPVLDLLCIRLHPDLYQLSDEMNNGLPGLARCCSHRGRPMSGDDGLTDHCGCCGHRRTPGGCGGDGCPCWLPPSEDRCQIVEVDGEPVRVQGSGEWTEKDRWALGEVIAAAKRKLAADAVAAARESAGGGQGG